MNDPRVAFFEPLKLVAKMRNERRKYRDGNRTVFIDPDTQPASTKISGNNERLLLLRVDEAGHGGSSGQYSYLEVMFLHNISDE